MTDKEPHNPFDDLGFSDPKETQRIIDQQRVSGEKLDNLIHRAFVQNEAGAELLQLWSVTLMMRPTAQPGQDSIEIGINEGIKQFIRNIILTTEKVENGESK